MSRVKSDSSICNRPKKASFCEDLKPPSLGHSLFDMSRNLGKLLLCKFGGSSKSKIKIIALEDEDGTLGVQFSDLVWAEMKARLAQFCKNAFSYLFVHLSERFCAN